MSSNFKRIAKTSIAYSIQDIFEKGLGVFLMPIYTSYLVPEEYGIIALMSLFSSLLVEFFLVGQPNAIMRFYFDFESEERKNYLGTIFSYVFVVPVCLSFMFFLWGKPIFEICFPSIKPFSIGLLAMGIACFSCLPTFILTLWRTEENIKNYLLFSLSSFIFRTFLILIFIIAFGWGAKGQLYGVFISQGLFWLISIWVINKKINWHFSYLFFKKSILFGLPLIPHILSAIILSSSDRYMIEYYCGLDSVGLYSVAYSIGSIALFVSAGFGKALGPFFYSQMSQDMENARFTFSRLATIYFTAIIFITAIMHFFSNEIVSVLTGPAYKNAGIVAPVVSLGIMFNCFYNIPIYTLYYFKKTNYIPILTGFSAIINIVFNLFLIPPMGNIGAAWATFVAYLFMFFSVFIVSQKLFFIPYEKTKISKIIFFIGFLFLLNKFVLQTLDCECFVMKSFLYKVISLASFFPYLYINKFFDFNKARAL